MNHKQRRAFRRKHGIKWTLDRNGWILTTFFVGIGWSLKLAPDHIPRVLISTPSLSFTAILIGTIIEFKTIFKERKANKLIRAHLRELAKAEGLEW